jgi:hypothetical protein
MTSGHNDFEAWTDARLRAWIQARLEDRLLPDEAPSGREEFPLWMELASLVDQACRAHVLGLDAGQAARIRQIVSEEVAEFLKQPRASAADLGRGLQVLLRGGEMAERPRELQLSVGPVLLNLIERLETGSGANVELLRMVLAAAWAISLPLPQDLVNRLIFRDDLLPWVIPFLRASDDRTRHPRTVARALARYEPGSPEEQDLLLWTSESLPETARELDFWRGAFDQAAVAAGLESARIRRWLLDLGVIQASKLETPSLTAP